MNDIHELLVEPFRRLLADIVTPEAIRLAERSEGPAPLWADIEASGFLDALVAEEEGGAGLSLSEVFPLVTAAGEHVLPGPFAETMVARALLLRGGADIPDGAVIVLAPQSPVVPFIKQATHALVEDDGKLALVEIDDSGADVFGAGGGQMRSAGKTITSVDGGSADLLVCAAALTAAQMAGMMTRLLDMSVSYVGERQQFGRPLGRFQAIQHQLAVMAEQTASAHVAARIGMSGDLFSPLRVAMAKCRVSEASHMVAAIAHAVHGAIGVTEEYDLQLVTRRLKQGQLAFGSESFWAARLGSARLDAKGQDSVDFVREHLQDSVPG
ncbi:MAG: acyl-CoA dehydrogenase family protein [Blastomonas sp.]